MLLAHCSTTGLVALKTSIGDELTHEVTLGPLERGTCAREFERLLLLALSRELVHNLANLLGIAAVEIKGGRKHDHTLIGYATMAIP